MSFYYGEFVNSLVAPAEAEPGRAPFTALRYEELEDRTTYFSAQSRLTYLSQNKRL